MSDDLIFGVKLTGDGKSLRGELASSRDEMVKLKKATDDLAASSAKTAGAAQTDWAKVQQSMNASAQAWLKGNAAADAAADKAWALANGYKEVGGYLRKTGDAAAEGMEKTVWATTRAQHSMVTLGREVATGNISQIPGTLSIIAQGLSPVALGVAAVTAALGAGAWAWWKWGEDARYATEAARKGADEAEAAADRAQQPTSMERLADMSEKIGKLNKEIVDLAEKSRRLGKAGEGGKGELWDYQKQIDDKQREIAGLQRQAQNLWGEIEKAQERASKPKKSPKHKREFDPEGDFWFAVDEAGIKKRKKAREDAEKDAERSATETARKIADAQEKEAKRSAQSWDRFTENVQRNLGDVLYNQLNGKFLDIEDLFKQMLFRMAADAAAANLTQSLFGGMAGFAGLGTALGFNGGMVDPVTGIVDAGPVAYGGSFAGGGFTGSGPRSGGLDGMGGFPAILHPNETVIDHAAGQNGGSNTIYLTYAPVTQIDARSDLAQVQQIADASARRNSAELVDKLQRAGAL